jgi:hypothetical protein
MDQLPLHRGAFQNAQRTSLETRWRIHAFNRPVNLVEIFEKPKILPYEDHPACYRQRIQDSAVWDLSPKILRLKRRPKSTGGGFKPGSI